MKLFYLFETLDIKLQIWQILDYHYLGIPLTLVTVTGICGGVDQTT